MEPPPPHSLTEDLQLEIIARTDAATVVSSAAASKPLRRAILDPAFRRRIAVASKGGGFDPSLLVDVSYRIRNGNEIIFNPSQRVPFERRLLNSFEPACSRDGVVVLWRNRKLARRFHEYSVELRVCNSFTGHHAPLPGTKLISGSKQPICGGVYRPALLTMGEEGASFKLLVMDRSLQMQTFSSQDGKWGAVHQLGLHSPQIIAPWHVSNDKVCRAPAAVIGRTVHWLCHLARNPLDLCMIILAVDADTAQATSIQLPEGCVTSLGSWNAIELGDPAPDGRLMLAATPSTFEATMTTRLSLLVAEPTAISMWTLVTPDEGSNGWSRQTVIRRREIERQLGSGLDTYQPIRFKGFGERSGTVIFLIQMVGLVQLNLVTKTAVLLRGGDVRACLHEVNLASLLCGMKPFY